MSKEKGFLSIPWSSRLHDLDSEEKELKKILPECIKLLNDWAKKPGVRVWIGRVGAKIINGEIELEFSPRENQFITQDQSDEIGKFISGLRQLLPNSKIKKCCAGKPKLLDNKPTLVVFNRICWAVRIRKQ